jgi:hypothetical protein
MRTSVLVTRAQGKAKHFAATDEAAIFSDVA